jgi:hypothetical protein
MSSMVLQRKPRLRDSKKFRLFVAFAVTAAIGSAAFGFTASNTVPTSVVGAGSGSASGYTVSNVHYNLSSSNPLNVDSLTFSISPSIPSTSTGRVVSQVTLTSGGPNNYTCTTNTTGDTVTCATTSPLLVAGTVTGVTVVAAQ